MVGVAEWGSPVNPDPAVTAGLDWIVNIPKRSSLVPVLLTGLTCGVVVVEDDVVAGLCAGSKGPTALKLFTATTTSPLFPEPEYLAVTTSALRMDDAMA